MRPVHYLLALAAAATFATPLTVDAAPELVHAKDGSGIYGYADTPVLPPWRTGVEVCMAGFSA